MTSALKGGDEGGVILIEPSHISVRSWGQRSLSDLNINYIDHLREGQSLVCIGEVEVVVDAASKGKPMSARSSQASPYFRLRGCTGYPSYALRIGDPSYLGCVCIGNPTKRHR